MMSLIDAACHHKEGMLVDSMTLQNACKSKEDGIRGEISENQSKNTLNLDSHVCERKGLIWALDSLESCFDQIIITVLFLTKDRFLKAYSQTP